MNRDADEDAHTRGSLIGGKPPSVGHDPDGDLVDDGGLPRRCDYSGFEVVFWGFPHPPPPGVAINSRSPASA